jgi:GNAT superfamily N-acetyltransferase
MYGYSTLHQYRGKGIQSALIAASLARAAQRGCKLALTFTVPEGSSRRNFERRGFRFAHTRTKFGR